MAKSFMNDVLVARFMYFPSASATLKFLIKPNTSDEEYLFFSILNCSILPSNTVLTSKNFVPQSIKDSLITA